MAFPERLTLEFFARCRTSATARTRTSARPTTRTRARRHLLSQVEQLNGKELSFINLYDLNGALLLREFALPACVIVKHANACGRRRRDDRGGIRPGARVRPALGLRDGLRGEPSVPASSGARNCGAVCRRVVYAPAFMTERSRHCGRRPALRVLAMRRAPVHTRRRRPCKRVLGGLLVQDRDWDIDDRESMQVVAGSVTEEQWGDLLFAWRVCKHVGSNAIVLAKDLQTIGIGAGQQSRVDAVKIALDNGSHFRTTWPARCSRPTRSSHSRTGPSSRWRPESAGSSSRAARSATTR